MRGTAVRQVCEGVCVDRGGDVGVRPQRPIVAVPLFVAVVRTVWLHLSKAERVLPCDFLLPGQGGDRREEGDGGSSAVLSEAAAPFGPGPGL